MAHIPLAVAVLFLLFRRGSSVSISKEEKTNQRHGFKPRIVGGKKEMDLSVIMWQVAFLERGELSISIIPYTSSESEKPNGELLTLLLYQNRYLPITLQAHLFVAALLSATIKRSQQRTVTLGNKTAHLRHA